MSNDGTQERVETMFASMEAHTQTILDREKAAEESGEEDAREQAIEELYNMGYGEERKVLVTLTLAGGGPSAWIEAVCNADNGYLELEEATYIATWGGPKVTTELREGMALYTYTERMIEGMEA
jgi:hypothetical protein